MASVLGQRQPRWKRIRRQPAETERAAYESFCRKNGLDPLGVEGPSKALLARNDGSPVAQDGAVSVALAMLRQAVADYGALELAGIQKAHGDADRPSNLELESKAAQVVDQVMDAYSREAGSEKPTVSALEGLAAARTALEIVKLTDSRGRAARKALTKTKGNGERPLDVRLRKLEGTRVV